MTRILFATYMARYPLGGMLSWAVQPLLGLHRLGHEVFAVERANYSNACFDPRRGICSDDCRAGYRIVVDLLERLGLQRQFIFESFDGELHGISRQGLSEFFRSADLMIDAGNHGAWLGEAREAGLRTVMIDGEPGYTQMKFEIAAESSQPIAEFDYYYTNGANIGTARSNAPIGGREWRHIYSPVDTETFSHLPSESGGSFTTVMNWQSHAPIEFRGRLYGQKDVEFARFIELPRKVQAPLEVAAAGSVPVQKLALHGWTVQDAHRVTASYDSYLSYIAGSLGEFSVCKNVFVATQSGWFSDRSAAYLAAGRPVVMQDTGFGAHLPCGEGLFAVRDVDEAAAAIDEIVGHYPRHSARAREIARQCLDAQILMGRLLREAGV